MIYNWHPNIKKMTEHKTFESYWNSYYYKQVIIGIFSNDNVFVEKDTKIWNI